MSVLLLFLLIEKYPSTVKCYCPDSSLECSLSSLHFYEILLLITITKSNQFQEYFETSNEDTARCLYFREIDLRSIDFYLFFSHFFLR